MKKTIEGYVTDYGIDCLSQGKLENMNLFNDSDNGSPHKVTITYEVPDKKYSVTAEEIEKLWAKYLNDTTAGPFSNYIERALNQEGK